jgi:hypothetical protein
MMNGEKADLAIPIKSFLAGVREKRTRSTFAEFRGQCRLVDKLPCPLAGGVGDWGSKALQQGTSFWSITCLAERRCERYGCSSIRGNHMNLGGPTASRFSDGLRSFISAPVPSG